MYIENQNLKGAKLAPLGFSQKLLIYMVPDAPFQLNVKKPCTFANISDIIIITRCSTRETRETALLHVACGNPARRRYCVGAKFTCISSLHAYSYIQQSGRNLQTINAKNTRKKIIDS